MSLPSFLRSRFLSVALLASLGLPVLGSDFGARFEAIKKTATPEQLYTFLYAMPKGGDLHNHSGGAVRSDWWYAIATDPARNGGDTLYTRVTFNAGIEGEARPVMYRTVRRYVYEHFDAAHRADYVRLDQLTPGQKQAWLDAMRLDKEGEGRDEFFSVIWPRLGGLFTNRTIVEEALIETMRAYGAEGMRYLETQSGMQGFATNDGVAIPAEESAASFRERLSKPDAVATGVTVRFQAVAIRFLPGAEQQVRDLYRFVDAHRDLWVGLNMAGIEENGHGYPTRFLETFRELRRVYPTLALSIHAGEMDGADHNIRDTLLLGASRIGHGVNLIKDPETLLLLQQSRRVLVEVNLISNRLLEYTPDLSKHPFPEYLRTGVPVCLNTDDRGMWDSNLTDEFYTAVTLYHLSWDEIVQLCRNSLTYSFAQPETKAKLLAAYEKDLAAFVEKFAADDSLGKLSEVTPVTYGYGKRTWGFSFAR